VGNNGETLVADSSTSTGLRYTAGTVQGNPIINSAFQIWQRGTSFTVPSSTLTYTADRWNAYRAATNMSVTRQATNDTTNLPNIQYAARVQRTAGDTSTQSIYFAQSFETVNSIPYAGKTVTWSFYARAGANYSSASSVLAYAMITGTGTDQNWLSYTGAQYPINNATGITTTWQRYSVTGTIAASATEVTFNVNYVPVGTAGANDYFEITGMQVDIGSVALPFRTNAATIQGELAACQRYYYRTEGSSANSVYGTGTAANTTATYMFIPFQTKMRTAPTVLDYSILGVSDGATWTAVTSATLTFNSAGNGGAITANVASGLAQFRPYILTANGNSAGYIGFGAEL
jgi:hypothetical protein